MTTTTPPHTALASSISPSPLLFLHKRPKPPNLSAAVHHISHGSPAASSEQPLDTTHSDRHRACDTNLTPTTHAHTHKRKPPAAVFVGKQRTTKCCQQTNSLSLLPHFERL